MPPGVTVGNYLRKQVDIRVPFKSKSANNVASVVHSFYSNEHLPIANFNTTAFMVT